MLRQAVLITGASRGIGLEFVKQLSLPCENNWEKPALIIATCRKPENAMELQEIANADTEKLVIRKLDVDDFSTYTSFTKLLPPIVEDIGISCLINNAGISPKSTRYNMVTYEQMAATYRTNAIAPLLLSREMLPFLKKAADNNRDNGSLVVNVSSILGSIELNEPKSFSTGGIYPYRSSKTALNMITRSLSLDLKHLNVKAVAIHPGWVKTNLGGKNAPLTPEKSVAGILDVIANFNSELYNGKFVDYKGEILPF